MTSQSLSGIVQVTVEVSATATLPEALNIGLIVGTSTVIPTATRTVAYSSTSDMMVNGWTGTEPEYKAAEVYFGQSPTPQKVIIGRQDATVPETAVQAVTACRASDTTWYGVYGCGWSDSDIEAVAQFIESASPLSTHFYDTQDANVASGTTPNVMSTLQGDKYKRTFGLYTANVEYAGAAAMGVAMGLNTGLANSAFTMAYKSLVGITPDALTTQQVTNIQGWNGNVYTTFGNSYDLLVQGVMADGTPFDEVLNLDTLVLDSQTAVMNALVGNPKIPQTDAGVTILVNALEGVCADAATEDILGPGTWNGPQILGLKPGTALPLGYMVLADTIANQSAADFQARKSPPIYECVNLSGAIEHAIIGIIVNQ